CALLVPFMALFYMFACMVLLAMHIETVPQTIYLIVTSAFTGQAAVGGFAGAGMMQALRWGMARGLFSNESGLGSAPIVAAAAQTKNPVRQALISATGTFWDTVVVCALTGLVIVNSGAWTAGQGGDLLTKQAFGAIPVLGPFGLTIALFTFVFSTLLGWSYYGEKSIEYLLGSRAVKPYRWLWVGAVFAGSVSQMQMVWDFADIANALMAVPNIISLFVLSPVIVAETRKYLWEGRLEESGE
ncbi:MAG TPA: alanine:cation symporter family protein, partial [Oligoflexia bacterium]|nr:alanine:cation symporter family protein [Oligoflexia bacterium]